MTYTDIEYNKEQRERLKKIEITEDVKSRFMAEARIRQELEPVRYRNEIYWVEVVRPKDFASAFSTGAAAGGTTGGGGSGEEYQGPFSGSVWVLLFLLLKSWLQTKRNFKNGLEK